MLLIRDKANIFIYNMIIKKILLIFTVVFLLLFISCQKKEVHWDTDVLVPILTTTMGVDDIFGNENVAANPDQSMSIVVEERIELLVTDSVIEIDDTLAVDIFNLPFTFTIPAGQKVIEKEAVSALNFGEMELTKARAKRAKMKFYVTSQIKQPLLVKYQLFSATSDGAIYEVEERVEAATNTQNSYTVKEITLDNYNLDLTGPNGDAYNTIYATTTVWIHPDGDTAVVLPEDTIIIISIFDEFVPEYAFGYLGTQELTANSSSAINVFGDFISGSFDLENIEASIDVQNSLGVDLSLEIERFSAKNNATNTEISLDHNILGSSLNILRASESGIDDYPVWPKNYTYDISNSNLDEMVEIMPDSFLISVKGELNPLGNISAGKDFIYFDKGLETKLKMNIPLNFSANDLVIEDISSINIGNKSVKGGSLNIFVENSFPFILDLQFYIINDTEVIVDSLFAENNTIDAATTDNNGHVVSNSNSEIGVELTPNLLQALEQNNRMIIRAKVNSADNEKYVLFEYSNLQIKIIGDLEYEI